MPNGASFRSASRCAWNRPRLCQFFALLVILTPARGFRQKTVPQSGEVRQPPGLSPLLQQAEELLGQGSVEEAKKKIEEELQQSPSSVYGYTLLGIVYTGEKDYVNALKSLEKALSLDPASTRALNNLGNLYVAEKKLDLAEKEFRKVLRIEPGNRDGNYNLGLVLMAVGSPAEAISYLQRVRPPDNATRSNLIRAYLRAGRTAEALKMATELSAGNKDDVQLHFTLGVLLASEKQYRAAQLELERADALQPETLEVLYNLGQVYLRAGDYAKAELVLNRALKDR